MRGVGNNEDFRKSMGIKLRALRREAGLSQRDLARKLDLSHQQIQKYERGSNALPLERVRPFANALGVAPSVLAFPEVDWIASKLSLDLSSDQSELLRLYDDIPDRSSRLLLLDLVRSVGGLARRLP